MELKLGLIGYGNVGKSFIHILNNKKEMIKRKFDLNVKVIAIFEFDGALIENNGLNMDEILEIGENFRDLPYWKQGVKVIEIINDLNINACIETTPTNPNTGEPALSHIIKALENGIDVVASNKGPFFLEAEKIKSLAKKNNCLVRYEATVASCVPSLSIKENLIGNNIIRITAILNGTCNYILSRMTSEGIPFDIALKEAQELGYAEADPTLDIEGYDAAGKLVIIANELLEWSKNIKDVSIKGITKITPQAIDLAKTDGLIIKHLAIADLINEELFVEPRLIEKDSPLNISGTLNVIELKTKYAGPIVLMGRGAGGFEAASAILNDLIYIARRKQHPS
ncbi:MAG: homoserine dehydrogenase [Promethearchaeota archaeon]|nr:MAG: homoserine dehydrogenase [Candidatus Lokiarchaeota archaeon]